MSGRKQFSGMIQLYNDLLSQVLRVKTRGTRIGLVNISLLVKGT